jgi:pyrroloquinoline quinone biosynthesis protein B
MRLRVLGAAAGGGLPQWNCGCANCGAARAGDPRIPPRTQDSLALSADGERWLLVNASPDVLTQVARTPALHPRSGRATPIAGAVLTNGDLDHVLGLFSLRESTPLVVWCTAAVREGLERNPMLRTLQRFAGHLTFVELALDRAVDALGVSLTPFALPGKLPKHLEGIAEARPEDNVGLHLERGGARAVVATAAASLGAWTDRIDGADVALFDGTFWSSDELVRLGLGTSRAEDMAHMPVGGASGSLAALGSIRARRRVFAHVNNTNPMLLEGSEAQREVVAAGFEIAVDGMELFT